jgi:hypothetical protein
MVGTAIIEGHGCQFGPIVPNSHPLRDYNPNPLTDENGSDTNGYHPYYICFHISVRI